ncbi:MBL fold metallo-hydrolase [Sphingomonas sp. MMS24-JH45]
MAIVPRFLDRIYYEGPGSDHFDGARFFNPDGDADTIRPPGGGGRGGFFWRQLTGSDGRPAWPGAVPVARVAPPARVAGRGDGRDVGGACERADPDAGVERSRPIPVWSDRAGPLGFGPKRVAEPGIAFDDLPRIDLVLVSHNHYDHLDKATLKRMWVRDRPLIVTSLGNDSVIGQTGASATALDWASRSPCGRAFRSR